MPLKSEGIKNMQKNTKIQELLFLLLKIEDDKRAR